MKKPKETFEDYCVINQHFLKFLTSCNISANAYKLFMLLLSAMTDGNRITLSHLEIEETLGIDNKNLERQLSVLKKHRLIYTDKSNILLNSEIISPHCAYLKDGKRSSKKVDAPFMKQLNLEGKVDFINSDTGEVFYTS